MIKLLTLTLLIVCAYGIYRNVTVEQGRREAKVNRILRGNW